MSKDKKSCNSCSTPADKDAAVGEFMPTVVQVSSDCNPRGDKTHEYVSPSCNKCEKPQGSCVCSSKCENYQEMPLAKAKPSTSQVETQDLFAKVDASFTYPDVGHASVVKISNTNLAEGQSICSEKYGMLFVFAVLGDGEYELENKGDNDPELVGKQVPCGTKFAPCGGVIQVVNSTTANCTELLSDFRIPANGQTNQAQISSIAGFSNGETAIIRSKSNSQIAYSYTITGTSGTNEVTLRNDGQGGTAGQWLSADGDCDGANDWCIEPGPDADICEKAIEVTCLHSIFGCTADGQIAKITLDGENEVLSGNAACGGAKKKILDDTKTCVSLDSCFQVQPYDSEDCDHGKYTFTTSDDQFVLDEAAAALISDVAEPIIEICGYEFCLKPTLSSVGALVVIPNFNPDAVIFFDEGCDVCIPTDCCVQCNPQVNSRVIPEYIAPGLPIGGSMRIPYTRLTLVGHYFFKVVKVPTTGEIITLQYSPPGDTVLAAIDASGTTLDLANLPEDPAEYEYANTVYYNQSACPEVLWLEGDATADMLGLTASMKASFHLRTLMEVFACDELDTTAGLLSATQAPIVVPFSGETCLSTATGDNGFSAPKPPTVQKSLNAGTGFNRKGVGLSPSNCLRIRQSPFVEVFVEDPVPTPPGDLIIDFTGTWTATSENA